MQPRIRRLFFAHHYPQKLTPFQLITAAIAAISLTAGATDFDNRLLRSGYIHEPLPPATHRSLEAEAAAKPVLDSVGLVGSWSAVGNFGRIERDGTATVLKVCVNPGSRRARGPVDDPDYALYGHSGMTLTIPAQSLEAYNRLAIDIEPSCPGNRAVSLNLTFHNATGHSGPGFNPPTGAHLIHLDNYRPNRCYLEIADLKRDAVDAVTLTFSINGRDLASADSAAFRIAGVQAQRVERPEKVSGWQPDRGRIVHSMTGYAADGRKQAVADTATVAAGAPFRLVADDGTVAFEGRATAATTSIGSFAVLDFSSFTRPGIYRIEAAGASTEPFAIGAETLWEPSCWKVLNFIFCQRCGYAVPGVHSRCHADLMARHDGMRISYSGGWHDAGDLSQQTLQTADVAYSLLELSCAKQASNPLLAARLREEALWGLDFVLRSRFGDGHHASSVGLLIWQDGRHDSFDDINTVRVQDVAFDNFLYAAYEAYAARVLLDNDPILASHLAKVAEEDYAFACRRFARDGFGGWINPYEHTYCTGESQHMATASWAASMLYRLTGKRAYADDAARYGAYVLDCRCDTDEGHPGIKGFFYRTPQKRTPVHFIHQSRDQIFMQALTELCATQPSHPDCPRWRRAIADYASYLKALMRYTAPYGMLPAGVFSADEPTDSASFYALHLFPPSDAPEQFAAQARTGVDIGGGLFIRRFPIWFNIFNGNLAVHTSMGKSAAICARFLGDRELLDIAREQLYWTVGKNPFAQSLIYGEGYRYPDLNNFSTGRTTGAIPVGIRSLGDSDQPYWPQINNACYKEVWLTSAGKWLSLVTETELFNQSI